MTHTLEAKTRKGKNALGRAGTPVWRRVQGPQQVLFAGGEWSLWEPVGVESPWFHGRWLREDQQDEHFTVVENKKGGNTNV